MNYNPGVVLKLSALQENIRCMFVHVFAVLCKKIMLCFCFAQIYTGCNSKRCIRPSATVKPALGSSRIEHPLLEQSDGFAVPARVGSVRVRLQTNYCLNSSTARILDRFRKVCSSPCGRSGTCRREHLPDPTSSGYGYGEVRPSC